MSLDQIGLSNDGYDYSLVQVSLTREDRLEDEWCERELQKKHRNGFQPSKKDARQFDEVRRQIEANDPDVLPSLSPYLSMSRQYWPYDGDWEGAGRAIANNRYLNEIYVGRYNSPDHEMNTNTEEQFIAFWELVSDSSSVKKITLRNCSLLGGNKFFTLMEKFVRQQLVELRIEKADMNDEGASVLASILSKENVLGTLKIEGGVSVEPWRINKSADPLTNEGWKSIVGCLQSSHCKITSLRISESSMVDDSTASILADGLRNNSHLKKLSLDQFRNITDAGWQSIISALQTNNTLEHLLLVNSSDFLYGRPELGEDVVNTLVNSLTNNHTLKSLKIMRITEEGLRSFVEVLHSPLSVLEEFTCKDTSIGFDTAILLANSLTGNTKMKKLVVKEYPGEHHTEFAMVSEAFSRLVCNKSSIMATYESNHKFQEFDGWCPGGGTTIKSILQVNKNSNSPAAAARSKIIKTHFSDFNVKEFVDMDEEVYPQAAAWMARDIDGLSLLFKFLTGIPLDLDGSAVGIKSECDAAGSKKKQKNVYEF